MLYAFERVRGTNEEDHREEEHGGEEHTEQEEPSCGTNEQKALFVRHDIKRKRDYSQTDLLRSL